jgi:hypothetical protein
VLRATLADARLVCLTADERDPLYSVPDRASIDHICISDTLAAAAMPRARSWPASPLDRDEMTDHFGVYADLMLQSDP